MPENNSNLFKFGFTMNSKSRVPGEVKAASEPLLKLVANATDKNEQ